MVHGSIVGEPGQFIKLISYPDWDHNLSIICLSVLQVDNLSYENNKLSLVKTFYVFIILY